MQRIKSKKKNWREKRLGDVVDFQYGYTASAKTKGTGVKLLRITDIVPDLIDWENVPYCDIDQKKFKQFEIKEGDILVARTGATAGYAKLIRKEPPPSVFASYLIRLKLKDDMLLNSGYVGRIIESELFKGFVTAQAGGSAQPHANAPVLKNFELLLPEVKIQKQIADVLSTYDDLIENNTRRIQILEELAQAIYKEWFVNFRFPGHETVRMVDSKTEFGMIPEGWEVSIVGDITELLSGYSFKSKTFIDNGLYRVVTIKSVQDGKFVSENSDTINNVPENLPEHCKLNDGDILLSLTGNVGRVCFVFGKNLLLNQRVAKLKSLNTYSPFVYSLFRNPDFKVRLQNIANGSAQQNLSPIQTSKLMIVVPDQTVLDQYSKVVNPILKQIVLLSKQNIILRQARDLLLPKLVTGEIEVE